MAHVAVKLKEHTGAFLPLAPPCLRAPFCPGTPGRRGDQSPALDSRAPSSAAQQEDTALSPYPPPSLQTPQCPIREKMGGRAVL